MARLALFDKSQKIKKEQVVYFVDMIRGSGRRQLPGPDPAS